MIQRIDGEEEPMRGIWRPRGETMEYRIITAKLGAVLLERRNGGGRVLLTIDQFRRDWEFVRPDDRA